MIFPSEVKHQTFLQADCRDDTHNDVHEPPRAPKSPQPPWPSTSDIFPPPWLWTSNYKRTPSPPPPFNKLWNNSAIHVNERNQNKNKSQVVSHSNWPRFLLFDLAHEQCNGIIKGWLHCLSSESKGKFLAINILMFDSGCLQQVCKIFRISQERSEVWSWFIVQMSITVIALWPFTSW